MANFFAQTSQNSKGQNIAFVGAPVQRTLLIRNVAAAGSVAVPKGARIVKVIAHQQTANAVTGGIKFGSTSGAVDIVAALAVAGTVDLIVTDLSILKNAYAAAGSVFFDAVTGWNSAVVDIAINYEEYPLK